MSAWLYIAAGIVVFVICLSALVVMTLADDWEQVNNEARDEIEKTR